MMMIIDLKEKGDFCQYLRWQALIMNQNLGKKEKKMDGGASKTKQPKLCLCIKRRVVWS
jgi:hypothetical protein